MKLLHMADAVRYRTMTTAELRATFLLTELFQPGRIDLAYVDLDRTVIGSAAPVGQPLVLPCDDALKAKTFTERRELGILNIGGPGTVTVNDERFDLDNLDALYVGRGNESVSFASQDLSRPAEFYLLSYPAHAAHPTTPIRSEGLARVKLGAPETANQRRLPSSSTRPACAVANWSWASRSWRRAACGTPCPRTPTCAARRSISTSTLQPAIG